MLKLIILSLYITTINVSFAFSLPQFLNLEKVSNSGNGQTITLYFINSDRSVANIAKYHYWKYYAADIVDLIQDSTPLQRDSDGIFEYYTGKNILIKKEILTNTIYSEVSTPNIFYYTVHICDALLRKCNLQ